MEKPTFEIFNIITSINFHTEFDLDLLHSTLPKTEYNPTQFPGLIYRPKGRNGIHIILFKSGKAICALAKTQMEAAMAVNTLRKKLKQMGFRITYWHDSTLETIFAIGKLDSPIDLNQFRLKFKGTRLIKNLEKLREHDIKLRIPDSLSFPCVLFRIEDPKALFLLFGSGEYIIHQTQSEEKMSEPS